MRLLLVSVALVSAVVGQLSLHVADDGQFDVNVAGKLWLRGSEYRVNGFSTSAKTLEALGRPSLGTGSDKFGDYTSTTLRWAEKGTAAVLMETSFRTYQHDQGLIVFEQHFPQQIRVSPQGRALHASTLFPGFVRNAGPTDALRCFSYHGVFPSIQACTGATYNETHLGGVPLAIYDQEHTVVFSPLTWPKAQHMASTPAFFGAGIKSTVDIIPGGWRSLWVLTLGRGVNDGFMAWGDRVLKWTGKHRADMYLDETHGNIGFWTDNGGYYHYSTGVNKSVTYEEMLPKVKAYHDEIGVPFAHWQFDSWFYPKDGAVNPGGGGGAVTNWTSDPTIFPKGMANIQSLLKVPIVMHNRQWSITSDYVKNLPFKWYFSKEAAIPQDPIAFFEWFFTQQQGWGLSMYEQDWMSKQNDVTEALQTNISLGDLWLEGMAIGAAKSGRTIQYCMPYPLDVLSSTYHTAVTNIRATGDYFHSLDQWAVGGTAILYAAIGVLPFKDGFYSSTHKQIGGQTEGPELHPDREAIMATLSTAMVGPMDGIFLLNASRVMTTCRRDGKVLKPDHPITRPDACFYRNQPLCHIYTTFTDVMGYGRVRYFFNNRHEPLTPELVYLKAGDDYVVYNWYDGSISKLSESVALAAGYENHIYAIISPQFGAWAFLGEVDKYTTAARLRFPALARTPSGFSAEVVGVAGESVRVCASHELKLVCQSVAFPTAGLKTVHFPPTEAVEVAQQ